MEDCRFKMEFPLGKLTALEEKISSTRWVVPVLPDQELEVLLNAAIEFALEGTDETCPPCQRFYAEGLTFSFVKLLTDDAVPSWKPNIQQCIRANCERLICLCVLKLDNPELLNLLAILFNPNNKFHSFNSSKQNESNLNEYSYARSPDHRNPRGWLVDLINWFGYLNGFQKLTDRFYNITGIQKSPSTSSEDTTLKADINPESNGKPENSPNENTTPPIDTPKQIISTGSETPENEDGNKESSISSGTGSFSISTDGDAAATVLAVWRLIRPFGLCHEFLTVETINKYLMPLLEVVPSLLERLSDDELKKENKATENKLDTVSCLIWACKCLASRATNNGNLNRDLEMFRLKMILRLLQMPSFNNKMSALNEVNQIIGSVSQQYKPDWLTASAITNWIRDNNVLDIVLRDSLHQPQYVERLEKMLRFMIREGALTTNDLDAVWGAQHGKHEAIVKNVHDLLAKLAWDFTPDQLDHLFDCFKASWSTSSKKQSDKLLEVIRRLAEDDKAGVMAHKVLILFWNLAHSTEVCTEIMDVALANHVKILDYSCTQDRDAQKTLWLDKCVEELKNCENWVLPALKQIREICCLYDSVSGVPLSLPSGTSGPRLPATLSRQAVIERLQSHHSLVILVTNSLTSYMDRVRKAYQEQPNLDWDIWLPDGRYLHSAQVQERLAFLRFLLKDGQLWLCAEQAKQIWICLAENAVAPDDREACFKWFSKLMGEEPDLDPGINHQFFRQNILTLNPQLLTHSGIKCFERFFKAVNSKEGHLKIRRKGIQIEEPNLIGLDYLWRVVCECSEEIALRGVELMREVCASPGARLAASSHHSAFTEDCCEKLKIAYNELCSASSPQFAAVCCVRLCRVLRVLTEYVEECDKRFTAERLILPLYRAGRGQHICLIVRFQPGQRQLDDMEVFTHSNEILQVLRNNIHKRLKCASGGSIKLELCLNGEVLDHNQDRKLLSEIPIRDKSILTGKVCHAGLTGQSSNESSSDSSMDSPPPAPLPECALPGVILSHGSWQTYFILDLEQKACEKNNHALAYSAHELIQLLPPHQNTLDKIQTALLNEDSSLLQQLIFDATPPSAAYHIQVLYTMIMPSIDPLSEKYRLIQLAYIRHAPLFLDAISNPDFLKGGPLYILRNGMLHLLKIVKLALTTIGHFLVFTMPNNQLIGSDQNQRINIKQIEILKEALHSLPNQKYELMLIALAEKLAKTMSEQFSQSGECVFINLLSTCLPSNATIKAASSHALLFASSHIEEGKVLYGKTHFNNEDVSLVREALEVITLCVALSDCKITTLLKETWWQDMMVQLVITCPNPQVRVCCAEQLLAICSWDDSLGAAPALSNLLTHINGIVKKHTIHAHQYFQLLCRLIAAAGPQTAKPLLAKEVSWIKNVQQIINDGQQVDDTLLEGHLSITKEIFLLSPSEIKYEYGSHPDMEHKLIKVLVCDFLWPCSWAQLNLRQNKNEVNHTDSENLCMPTAVCLTSGAIAAACELLVALCYRCSPNMALLTSLLTDLFYSDSTCTLSEWDYLPAVGPRASSGLVGLKNAGATCYMNSILQQLYMVPAIRDVLLKVQGAVTNPNEDFSGEEKTEPLTEENANYNVEILKQVQAIFAHLHYSKLQYYVPRGLWTRFKLQGEPVNPREQQDAVEFFMSLVESLDEALKTLGQEQLMANTLGGSFSDQKICKECPHRYCKEEPFSVLSLDIRNMSRLQESLEAYVRGELLEGADAYQCDKCNKKVVTVKRVCLNKLPPVLGIQLKRFEYDFDRVCPIKFNDYFEFPRELDLEPYTVWGLAKAEGDSSLLDGSMADNSEPNTKYNLSGIVVHSGQASGGHYYSFILHRDSSDNMRWLKFDDGDVSECGMQDDEEMKIQCFGGDYMGELIDQINKRVSYKRQKRWWNAYMLFYTREDCLQGNDLERSVASLSIKDPIIPKPIWECVKRGNISFSHHQSQLSLEYFNFIKKLCCMKICGPMSATVNSWDSEQEELSMLCVQLATKFLFSVGFRTKKNLRGSSNDWYEILCQHLRCSPNIRSWFASNAIFQNPQRMCEYLLICPSAEVRMTFMKLVVFLAHFSIQDPLVVGFDTCGKSSLSDQLLAAVVSLISSREAAEYARHISLLFNLFLSYAALGLHEKHQLLKLNVVHHMISISTDDVSQASVKYQFLETVKLHQVVSLLVRCCDVSSRCQSSNTNGNAVILPNPFSDPPLTQNITNRPSLPLQCAEALYNKTSYIKKLIEEYNSCEEIMKLIQFLAWENPLWSRAALSELLWQISYAYCHDLRHHMDLLLSLLLLEDSWQTHRIHNAVKGDEKDGLLDNIIRARGHYQKRAYQCIKLLVTLFSRSQVALQLLHDNRDIRRRWTAAVAWLHDELDRQRFGPRQYNYNTWSPPGTSNDVSSGYFLERSNSARKTLERAYMLCPEDEDEEASCSDKESESGGEEKPPYSNDDEPPDTFVVDTSTCNNTVNNKENSIIEKTTSVVTDPQPSPENGKEGAS